MAGMVELIYTRSRVAIKAIKTGKGEIACQVRCHSAVLMNQRFDGFADRSLEVCKVSLLKGEVNQLVSNLTTFLEVIQV